MNIPFDFKFDPFCGSGTTGIAANLCERRFAGIELSGKEAVLIGETYSSPVGVLTFPLVFLVPEEILVLLFLLLRGLG